MWEIILYTLNLDLFPHSLLSSQLFFIGILDRIYHGLTLWFHDCGRLQHSPKRLEKAPAQMKAKKRSNVSIPKGFCNCTVFEENDNNTQKTGCWCHSNRRFFQGPAKPLELYIVQHIVRLTHQSPTLDISSPMDFLHHWFPPFAAPCGARLRTQWVEVNS